MSDEGAAPSSGMTGRRKWLLAGFKLLIVAAVIWGVGSTLRTAVDDLGRYDWTIRPAWLVVAAVFHLGGTLPAGVFWHRMLWAMGQRPALGESLRAYYIGQLGKYVPGKAMVVVMRAGLLPRDRVDATVAALSVFLETLSMMAVGALMSAGILWVILPDHRLLLVLALAVMAVAGLLTLLPVFRRLVRMLPRAVRSDASAAAMDGLGLPLMCGGWLGLALGWGLLGSSLWAVLKALGVENLDPVAQLPLLTAAVAMAVVAGFLSLLPGGAVVRELILTQIMVVQFGEAVALVSAVFLRLVWMVSELAISGILYAWGRRAACYLS